MGKKARGEAKVEGEEGFESPFSDAGGDPFAPQIGTEMIAQSPPMVAPSVVAPFRPATAQRPPRQQVYEEPLPVVVPKRYRVTDSPRGPDGQLGSVHIGKFNTRLPIGKILDERSYDIRQILQQGVKLEEIDAAGEPLKVPA